MHTFPLVEGMATPMDEFNIVLAIHGEFFIFIKKKLSTRRRPCKRAMTNPRGFKEVQVNLDAPALYVQDSSDTAQRDSLTSSVTPPPTLQLS